MICSELEACYRYLGLGWEGVWFLRHILSLMASWSLGAGWRVDMGAVHRSWDGGHAVVAAPSLHMLLVLLLEVLVASVRPHLLVAVVHLVLDVRSVVAVDVALLLVALLRTIPPLVVGPAPRVHEEVANGGGFQAELSSNGDLHLLRGALCLLVTSCE